MPILGCLDFLKGTATLGFQILPAGGITGAPQMRWCSPNGTVSLEMVRIRDSAEVRRGVPPTPILLCRSLLQKGPNGPSWNRTRDLQILGTSHWRSTTKLPSLVYNKYYNNMT